MRVVKSVPVEEIACRGSIKGSDVQRLMDGFAANPIVGEDEAEALLLLNRSCAVQTSSWRPFLVDVLADFHIHQMGPQGYITSEKSRWLIEKVSVDGWVSTRNELDLLLAILNRARWFPLSLAIFALEQVRGAIAHGAGPLRAGPVPCRPGQMMESDVALVRDVLCAFGAGASLPVTKAEAEILFEIEDVVRGAGPADWADLFAKAIGNLVLAANGYAVPQRDVALRSGGFSLEGLSLSESVAYSLAPVLRDYSRPTQEELAMSRLERQRLEIVTQEEVFSPADSAWIEQRLNSPHRRGPRREAEIVNFLRREAFISADPVGRSGASGGRAA